MKITPGDNKGWIPGSKSHVAVYGIVSDDNTAGLHQHHISTSALDNFMNDRLFFL